MDTTSLVAALAPAFAAGFALQRLLEILDPILDRIGQIANKKIVLGLISLLCGFGLAYWLKLGVLSHLVGPGVSVPALLDFLVTSLVISGGTEGFNAILKFVDYKKEETKATALTETLTAESANRRMALAKTFAGNVANEREEIMDSIAANLVRVLSAWSRVGLTGFEGGLSLGGLWDQGHLMTIQFDPQGIDTLKTRLQEDEFFKNNPKSAELQRGDFQNGGGIQTEGDLFDFLNT